MIKLSEVLSGFGFKTEDVQEAFLENLYFAGYFDYDKIWQAINQMQYDQSGNLNAPWDNLRLTFLYLKRAVNRAGAGQKDFTKFNVKKLLDNFLVANIFDHQDVEDVMVYIAQNAFGRVNNQERKELPRFEWMDLYKEKYLENSKKLNLIDEINPTLKKYHETWIQGSARGSVITRMSYLKKLQESGIETGTIRLLSGVREIWVESALIFDIDESKNFMLELALDNNIKVNPHQPFMVKKIGEANRTYLNYAPGETSFITETMMAKKMYHKIFGHDIKEVVDSKASPGSMRPNTEQNAKDASWPLQEKIRRGDFGDDEINILVISNQPYCKRQEITISRSIKKIIPDRKIFFEGVGTAAKADIAIIHSELAALVTEMFLRKIEQDHEVRKRKPEQLMFSTRYAPEISITPPNNSQL